MHEFSKNPYNTGDSDYSDDDEFNDELGVEIDEVILPNNQNETLESPTSDVDVSQSDDSDFDPDLESDSDSEDEIMHTTSDSRAGPSTSKANTKDDDDDGGDDDNNDDDDEEDETIKAIRNAIKKPRTHPPEIKVTDFVTDLSFHPSRDILALGNINGDILIYKYANEGNELLKSLEVHIKACRSLEFDDDGDTILSASKDKSIMITDVTTEKLKQFYDNAHDEPIYKLYVIDENLFSTGDETGTIKLWDQRQKDSIFALKEVDDYISSMFTNDGKKLLVATSGDGYLTTISIGGRKLYVQSEPYEEELNCMGLYRNDSKLIVGTSKGKLYSYKWGEFGYHSDMYPGVKAPIECMIPITDRIACVSGEEGILRAIHIAPFKNLGIVGQHKMSVESMDINHSGEFIASCSLNDDILFWNIKYFEDFNDLKFKAKQNNYKDRRHNLPSSKISNASDFFADLA